VLFRSDPNHIAISLGDGRTMEARGRKYGVGIFDNAAGREWTAAGTIPGLS
jgi:cell wall-associated NlpC family hydrolase